MRISIEELFNERMKYIARGLHKKRSTKNYQKVIQAVRTA